MDNLFVLIKSMSKNEKRYFKLYSSAFSKEGSDYLRLFEAIDNSKIYDEAKLKKTLNIKHFSVTKRYLLDAILKCLRTYLTDDNRSFQILDSFKNISILRNRGMLKEAIKVYEKTEAQLKELNLYTFWIELQNTGEVLWSMYLPNKDLPKKLGEIEERKMNSVESLYNLLQHQKLCRSLRNTYRDIYPIRLEKQAKVFEEHLDLPLLKSVKKAHTALAESYFYESMALIYTVLLRFEKVEEYAEEAVEKFLSIKDSSLPQQKALIGNLSNLLLALAKLKKREKYEEYSVIFEQLSTNLSGKLGHRFDVLTQKLSYCFTLNFLIEQDDFEAIIDIEKEVRQFWEKEEGVLDIDWKNTVAFIIAQALFFKKEYDRVLSWLDYILKEEKNNPKMPSICNARILNVIVHFEKEEYQFLDSLIRSTYRYLSQKNRLFKIEELLLKFFRWVAKHPDGQILQKKNQLFENLQLEISQNRYEKNFFEELKLDLWKADFSLKT